MRLACSLLVAVLAAAMPRYALAQEWGEFQPHSDRVNSHGVLDYKFRRARTPGQDAPVHHYQVYNPNDDTVRIRFSPVGSLRALVTVTHDDGSESRYDTRTGQLPPTVFELAPRALFTMRIELHPGETSAPARGLGHWTRPVDDGPPGSVERHEMWARQVDAALADLLKDGETGPAGELDELVAEVERARAVPPGDGGDR